MASQDLVDKTVIHQIELQRYSNSVVRRIMTILNRADANISAALTVALEKAPASATVKYLDSLLESVVELNKQAYKSVGQEISSSMGELAGFEARWNQSAYQTLDVAIEFASVTAQSAYSAAVSTPFEGRLLKEWVQGVELGKMTRIRSAVRSGYFEGLTTPQIVQSIRGTKKKGYLDGVVEIDRRHAEAVVRTALSHTAATTRDMFFESNEDILGDEIWISTLDGRTSQECRIRDGKKYTRGNHNPVGHSLPWSAGPGRLHWQCRSTAVALLKGQTELYGARASANGLVDANETYGDWLKRQPAAVQDDILGPSRGSLFREGGLSIDKFSNNKGETLTLKDLEDRYADAFKAANLGKSSKLKKDEPQDLFDYDKDMFSQPVFDKLARRTEDDLVRELGATEFAAVKRYTTMDYEEINGALRSNKSHPIVPDLDKAFANSVPLAETTLFQRGVKLTPEQVSELTSGAIWEDKAYTSVTSHPDIAKKFGRVDQDRDKFVVFRIKAPQGQKIIQIGAGSTEGNESESLLPRGTKMKVKSQKTVTEIKFIPKGKKYIEKPLDVTYIDMEIV
jgi:hypothetical protein